MVNPLKRLKRYSLVIAAIVVVGGIAAGIGGIAAGIAVLMREARQLERRKEFSGDIRQIAVSLVGFNDTYRCLPQAVHYDGAGRALYSWRFQLTSFIEGFMRSVEYDEPWDSPANDWLTGRPFVFSSRLPDEKSTYTNIMAITGPGTAFEEGRTIRPRDISPDTILAIEIANSGIHWAEPGDLDIEHIPDSITQGVEGLGVRVIFADFVVWFLRSDVPLEDLKKFFTLEGAKSNSREDLLRPYVIEVLLEGH
jgi:hypothetical protein